ncbi:MAG: tetraacyldisaccharide 4'-kinase [Vampirovibrionales bacterium]|nr:tetraacyldisaccharide 4'-kinase [Vampirovibrionales bacterium]
MSTFRQWVHKRHYAPMSRFWQAITFAATRFYATLVFVRTQMVAWGWLKPSRVPCPVITVGNVTTGGTGKTPVVEALCRELVAHGHRPLILTRGYAASEPIEYGQPQAACHGDEAFELKQALQDLNITVVVGKNRAVSAHRALSDYNPSVLVLDDGLQSGTLQGQPQINLLLIDGPRGLGNGQLLPMGPLREPVESALSRASIIALTRVDSEQQARIHSRLPDFPAGVAVVAVSIEPDGLLNWQTQQYVPLSWLAHRPVVALCGIAQPDSFFATLFKHQAITLETLVLDDHVGVSREALIKTISKYPPNTPLILTRKDAVKLPELSSEFPVWVLTQRANVTALYGEVARLLQAPSEGVSG